MFKKNSIFTRVLVPVIIATLLQTLLISLALFANGTVKSIENSAVESLRKNAENRGITLENTMINDWSNLDKLESDITAVIDSYLSSNKLTLDEVLGSYEHETGMLWNISGGMLNFFRSTTATGVFVCFVDEQNVARGISTYNGLYYRDLDPLSTPADFSDILFLRGFVDIARKDKIQLDSLWSEVFTVTPNSGETWNSIILPQKAALENPQLSSADLSYWSAPHLLEPDSLNDTGSCVTYTRPLIYNGRLIAVIGSEIQAEQMRRFFPASDFDSSGMGGYMLVRYPSGGELGDSFVCEPTLITGSYIRRLLSHGGDLSLIRSRFDGFFSVENEAEGIVTSVRPLRLYNEYSPFSGEQWALAAAGTNNMLFATAGRVRSGILLSSLISLAAGITIIAFTVKIATKPLLSLAEQIENSGTDDTIVSTKADTYETALLCSTINALRDRRKHIAAMLREERERYLIALESAGDTFMEYDIANDVLKLYHFSTENQKKVLVTREEHDLFQKIDSGALCHQDDISRFTMFFRAQIHNSIEVRVSAELFSHITGINPEDGFFWMRLNAAYITNDADAAVKVIGTARQIMDIKRKEQAQLETARRDSTTGLYNREYGVELIISSIYAAYVRGGTFAVCVLHIDNFKEFEAYYGRVFGGVVLMRFCSVMRSVMSEDDISVRLGNDEFMIYFAAAEKTEVRNRVYQLFEGVAKLYTGENAELVFTLSVGAALSEDAKNSSELLSKAYLAERYAIKTGGGHLEYFDELPQEACEDKAAPFEKPISVTLDISQKNIVGLAFDLFERTSDVHSVINLLLAVIGGLFNLDQIIICAYDAAFSTNQITYHWDKKGAASRIGKIDKVLHKDLAELEHMLDENGVQLFRGGSAGILTDGVRKLLCAESDNFSSTLCIVLYENVVQTGRILFRSSDGDRAWMGSEISLLYEISKIISARISIERSNSASRAKSDFLSRISHEIRTPMNAIIGMTGIAKESNNDAAKIEDCLEKIDFSAKHLLSLINDVLDMSRIESGRLELVLAPFSIKDFVSALDTLMRPQIEGREIAFETNIKCGHDHVVGDEYRLRQVLVNLLGNAGKFTDPGGLISLVIEEINAGVEDVGYYRFAVRDNGVGISKENQKMIFAAFTQAASGIAERGRTQGTGLGLAISSSIVNAMGGKIELESEPGEGSEFFFTLKLGFEDKPVQPVEQNSQTIDYPAVFAGKRVLLAEDNEINLEIATYTLEKAGLTVESAVTGLDALEKFTNSPESYYSAILMDIQMPVMDGLTAAREIRKLSSRTDAGTVPIIAMTANAFDEDTKKSIDSGMDGHIAKPIDNESLYELLSGLIGG